MHPLQKLLFVLGTLLLLVNLASAKGSFYSGRRSARYGYYSGVDANSYDPYTRHYRYVRQNNAESNRTALYGEYYSAGAMHLPGLSLLVSCLALVSLLFLRFNNRKVKTE